MESTNDVQMNDLQLNLVPIDEKYKHLAIGDFWYPIPELRKSMYSKLGKVEVEQLVTLIKENMILPSLNPLLEITVLFRVIYEKELTTKYYRASLGAFAHSTPCFINPILSELGHAIQRLGGSESASVLGQFLRLIPSKLFKEDMVKLAYIGAGEVRKLEH